MKSNSLRFITTAALAVSACQAALAQDDYPSKPIRIIVNVAAGGLADVTTRLLAEHMSQKLKQPIVVESQAGGGGVIAARAVKTAPADGYTLLAATATIVHQMSMRKDPGYDLLKDFTGIGTMGRSPYVVVVGAAQPDKTIGDLIARAKANPGKVSYASAGIGTLPHMTAERFAHQAGIQLMHVPYKGIAAASSDIVAGRVDMVFEGHAGSSPRIKAGQVRALAVTGSKRIPALPQVPTVSEQALPGFTAYVWLCLVAPAGTPKDVVHKLAGALRYAMAQPNVKERFETDATEDMDMSPEKFNQFLAQEVALSRKVVSDLKIEKE